MKTIIICFFLLAYIPDVHAQREKRIDSLKQLMAFGKYDSSQFLINFRLAYIYINYQADSALFYGDAALEIAQKLDRDDYIGRSNLLLATTFRGLGDYPKGFDYLERAKKALSGNQDPFVLRSMKMTEGALNDEAGYPDEALKIFKQVESDIVSGPPDLYNNYTGQNSTREGGLRSIYSYIAISYMHLNKPDSAIYYAGRSSELVLKADLQWGWPSLIMGNAYVLLNQPDKALEYYRLSYPRAKKGDWTTDIVQIYEGMARVFLMKGNTDSCIWYAKLCLDEARKGSSHYGVIESSQMLAEVYEKTDLVLSNKYYKITLALKDSLFGQDKIKKIQNLKFTQQLRKQELETETKAYQNKIRMYLLFGGLGVLLLITLILLRNNRQKQNANSLLRKQKETIETTFTELKSTQAQLIQSEKMASLGELTAGIAHEIQNPLNFINNFSEVSVELIGEMKTEIKSGNNDGAIILSDDLEKNMEKINFHGKRADAIVKGMLQHSRRSSGIKELTDINALADEYLRLSYHGLRAKDKSFNANMQTHFDEKIGIINIISQDMGRVLLNLFTNAFYSVAEKKKQQMEGYQPTVTVTTKKINDIISISVKDNGVGIPQKVMNKIYQPFFTTKPAGQGTGLGLSLSYDIITKAHGGKLEVTSKEGEGAEFIISLPA